MSSSISQVCGTKLLFTSHLCFHKRGNLGNVIFALWRQSEQQELFCLRTVFTNLWKWHIDWEIYSVQKTSVLSVDFPRVPALCSHRSHSSSRTMCENIWEEKKILFSPKNMCVFIYTRAFFDGWAGPWLCVIVSLPFCVFVSPCQLNKCVICEEVYIVTFVC